MQNESYKNIIMQGMVIFVLAFSVAFFVNQFHGYVLAYWPEAAAPSDSNVTQPINEGSDAQLKQGALGLGDDLHVTSSARIDDGLSVGTGAMPAVELDINGGIKVGDQDVICDSASEGVIRWNSGQLQGCDGSSWQVLNN